MLDLLCFRYNDHFNYNDTFVIFYALGGVTYFNKDSRIVSCNYLLCSVDHHHSVYNEDGHVFDDCLFDNYNNVCSHLVHGVAMVTYRAYTGSCNSILNALTFHGGGIVNGFGFLYRFLVTFGRHHYLFVGNIDCNFLLGRSLASNEDNCPLCCPLYNYLLVGHGYRAVCGLSNFTYDHRGRVRFGAFPRIICHGFSNFGEDATCVGNEPCVPCV